MILCFFAIIILSFFTGISLGYIFFEFYTMTRKSTNFDFIEGDEVGNFLEDIRRSRENGARMLKYDIGTRSPMQNNTDKVKSIITAESQSDVVDEIEDAIIEDTANIEPDYDFLKKYYYDSFTETDDSFANETETNIEDEYNDILIIEEDESDYVEIDISNSESTPFDIISNETTDETNSTSEEDITVNTEENDIGETSEDFDFGDFSFDVDEGNFTSSYDDYYSDTEPNETFTTDKDMGSIYSLDDVTEENTIEETDDVTEENTIKETDDIFNENISSPQNEDSFIEESNSSNEVNTETEANIQDYENSNNEIHGSNDISITIPTSSNKIESNVNIVIGSGNTQNSNVNIPLSMTTKPIEPPTPPKRKRGRPPKKKK